MAKINFSLICFSIVLILLFNGNVHGTVLGDIDGSDKVEVNDIILGLQILTGSTPGLKIHPEADVNRNKKLGLEEVIFDLQVVANLREEPSFYKLPELIRYEFSVQETKSLPGNSTEAGTGWNCAGIIEEEDKIGSIALVSLFYQNGCYTDGRYNHNNYQVERGVVHDIEDKFQFQSYKIYEPLSKATEFLASEHAVYYKFPSKEDYIVYTFENDTFSKVIEVPASEIITNEFIKLEELTVSRIEGSRIYVFVPSTQQFC